MCIYRYSCSLSVFIDFWWEFKRNLVMLCLKMFHMSEGHKYFIPVLKLCNQTTGLKYLWFVLPAACGKLCQPYSFFKNFISITTWCIFCNIIAVLNQFSLSSVGMLGWFVLWQWLPISIAAFRTDFCIFFSLLCPFWN